MAGFGSGFNSDESFVIAGLYYLAAAEAELGNEDVATVLLEKAPNCVLKSCWQRLKKWNKLKAVSVNSLGQKFILPSTNWKFLASD